MKLTRICKSYGGPARKIIAKLITYSTAALLTASALAPQAAAYTGVPAYFSDEFASAEQRWAIIPESIADKDMSGGLTRGDFCQVIVLAYERLYGNVPDSQGQLFADTDSPYVGEAQSLGIVSGYPDGTFRESKLISRQEMFKMIYGFLSVKESPDQMSKEEADKILSEYGDSGYIRDWAEIPSAAVISKGIVRGTDALMLNPLSNTTYAQGIVLVNRALISLTGGDLSYEKPKPIISTPDTSPSALTELGYNEQKYVRIFGSLSNDGYQTAEEAKANMVSVSVNVWKISSSGQKVPGTMSVTVNKAIADTVKAIFKEIYEGSEKFPIKSLGGYSWRTDGTSEHALGLAIDINPNENYMIKNDGTVVSGSFWDPKKSPYSIPADGDVVRAFRKYGFAWGGNAWRSSRDYMHFSYFGE